MTTKESAVVRLHKHEVSTYEVATGLRELAKELEQSGTEASAIRLEVTDLVLELEHVLQRIRQVRVRALTIPALVEGSEVAR